MKTIIHSALFLAFLSANPVGAVPPLSPPAANSPVNSAANSPANSPLNTPLEVLESKVVPGSPEVLVNVQPARLVKDGQSVVIQNSHALATGIHALFT
ncbi:hypothetical protein BDV30DRAFT_243417 [Aspergillus minisclerotigenes]|uniref:Plastocyanin-like domain-containing protein n=1 Tax=Aspergillus minisclerotigenes TaxID=656917 RepID=A0A5N6IR25_9EURO|nr:hypothetical protein BDV30DRAFT_243417 [Aspergillus minisclerotigenes]